MINGYTELTFTEGLPDSYGDYLFKLKDGTIASGHYTARPCQRLSKGKVGAEAPYRGGLPNPLIETGAGDFEECEVAGYLQHTNSIYRGLSDYPECIAFEESELFHYQQDRKTVEERIALYEAELELDIYDNPDLKNEGMRKAFKKKTLLESQEYLEMQAELETLALRETKTAIRLDKYKREFSVLKLETQLKIARCRED